MRAGQRESGSVLLQTANLPTTILTFATRFTATQFYSLVSVSESIAMERTLSLYCANPGVTSSPIFETAVVNFIAGDQLATIGTQAGSLSNVCIGLRLRYAIGETENVLYCDAKPGQYNIPACSRFTADLFAWRCNTVISAFPAINFSASVMPGACSVPTRPTKTAAWTLAAAATVDVSLDKHARWINAFAQVDNPVGTATNPILNVYNSHVAIQRNYQTGTWFPDGGACEVLRTNGITSPTITMANNGPNSELCYLVQYLEW